jgi:hypothetical protein
VEERPFAKLSQRREYLQKVAGISVSESTLSRTVRSMGFGRKKDALGASERDEFLRAAFRVMVMSSIEPERFVFVDECSSNTSLAPLYGWARRGERLHQKVPRDWGKNITRCSLASVRSGAWERLWWWRVRRTGRFSRPTWKMCSVPHAA